MSKIAYVGLHRHTTFSCKDGIGNPAKQIVPRLKEIDQTACAITDHASTFGHLTFYHALMSSGLKPILGIESYLVDDMRLRGKKETTDIEKRGLRRNEFAHVTLLAQTNKGYRHLLQLANLSACEGFYYEKRLDWPEIVKHQEGLIVLSGCLIGRLSQLIIADQAEKAYDWCRWLKERIENFYIEIIPCPSLDNSFKASAGLWKISEELNIPAVLTDDAHFPRPEDYSVQDVSFCVSQGKTMKDGNRYRIPDYHYYCTGDEILQRAKIVLPRVPEAKLRQAAERTMEIANSVQVELPKSNGPIYPMPSSKTPDILLQEWVSEGRAYRRSLGLLPEEGTSEWEVYVKREAYEWEIIRYHSFQNYFLLIADIVRWCKKNDYWCIARGSAGGSLLCWYLGITQIDPIKFKLPVERFIHFSRDDKPDIDLDFDARYRDMVFAYLISKYGADHCAQVGALSRWGARAAVRDVGKVYEIPPAVIEQVLLLVPESDADEGLKAEGVLELFFTEDDRIQPILTRYPSLRIASQLEGQIRQSTVHAAGFIVDEEPLDRLVAVSAIPGKAIIAETDKEGAARQGLLKFDALSVNMFAAIKCMLEVLGEPIEWLYQLPLDDPATYKMLASGRNMGIFQLQGIAAGKLMRQIQPDNFRDLVAISGLARPGPLQSGGSEEYVARRRGLAKMPAYHPIIGNIVNETYGIILFQEQVMAIAHDVGQFDMTDVNKIRKAVASIKGADAVAPFRDHYYEGAEKQNIPKEDAQHIWVQCLKAGNYCFNKAHGTQYALIAYWSAYLKAHYPALFTSIYSHWQESGDKDKRLRMRTKLFQEFRSQGGKFVLLDPNESKEQFRMLDEKTILGGFRNIAGCGEQTAEKLVNGQPYNGWDDFFQRCPKVVRERVMSIGLHQGKVDLDMALLWAPWYLEISFCDYERRAFEMLGCIPIKRIQQCTFGDVKIMGRVIGLQVVNVMAEAKKYGGRQPDPNDPPFRAVATISDGTGSIDVYYNPRKFAEILQSRDPFRGPHKGRANTVYVLAGISEDRSKLYAQDTICVKEPKAMTVAQQMVKPKRRPKKAELAILETQLQEEEATCISVVAG